MLKAMFLLKNLFLQKNNEVKDFSGRKRIAIGQNSTGAKLYFLMKAFSEHLIITEERTKFGVGNMKNIIEIASILRLNIP